MLPEVTDLEGTKRHDTLSLTFGTIDQYLEQKETNAMIQFLTEIVQKMNNNV